MKFSLKKHAKKLLLGAVLAIGCLGMTAMCPSEANAIERGQLFKSSYRHEMSQEFFVRRVNIFRGAPQRNSWGEIISRQVSGEDGSVTRTLLIGDLEEANDFVVNINVKSQIVEKYDSWNKPLSVKSDKVNYTIGLYTKDEETFKAITLSDKTPKVDITGDYRKAGQLTMSKEAAIYIIYRFMMANPEYRQKLLGAGLMEEEEKKTIIDDMTDLADRHTFKLVEHHPTHIVTRGLYTVYANGTITEYDIATDSWREIN